MAPRTGLLDDSGHGRNDSRTVAMGQGSNPKGSNALQEIALCASAPQAWADAICRGQGKSKVGGAGGADASRGVCLEAEGTVRRVQWQHVGAGNGAYERVDKFNYVGKGQGDHTEEELTGCCSSSSSRCCCCALMIFLFLGTYTAIALILIPDAPLPWLNWMEHLKTLGWPSTADDTPKDYDCKEGLSDWENGWPLDKKDWCCRYHGKGCPPDNHYDCKDGLVNWESGWSLGKKHFCCGYDLEGCTGEASSEEEEDTGRVTAVQDDKKTTTTEVQTTTTLYDCEHKLQEWETEWSPPKKEYCCKVFDFGCTDTTTPVPHDCEKDLDNWEESWDYEKKKWCCKHEHACASTLKETDENTHAAAEAGCDTECTFKDVTATCKDRINWVVNQPAPAGLRGKPHACEYALGLVLHDCSVCSVCSLAEAGCSEPVEDGEEEFDCEEGKANAQAGWSDEKKDFCCTRVGLGCPPVPPADSTIFHCNGDAASWKHDEKVWCCDHRELGCNI